MTTFTRPVEQYVVSCPNNDDGRISKDGFHHGKQRYQCQKCGKKFREPAVFEEGHHYTTQQIGAALQGYLDGQSYREVARSIGHTFETEPPDESNVYRWVQGYSRGAFEAMRRNKVPTSNEWVADELVVKVGSKKFWLWNVMDAKTRYLLATHLSPRRTQRAAEILFRKALEAAANPPEYVRTDGLGSYPPALQTVLPEAEHRVSEGLDAELHNNLSERLQGTIRERDKVLRGLHSRESGQSFLDGWTVDYNLIRPHMALGDKTPIEAAGLKPPFRNWLDVVRKVEPINKSIRPDWQLVDEKPMATKDFKKMDIDTAEEATRPLRPKAFKSAFRTRRGF